MSIEAPSDAYLRYCARLVWQGLDPPSLLSAGEPEAEPTNVSDIRAARTMRAVAQLMRGRNALRERPL